jgi:hypothetical protein
VDDEYKGEEIWRGGEYKYHRGSLPVLLHVIQVS